MKDKLVMKLQRFADNEEAESDKEEQEDSQTSAEEDVKTENNENQENDNKTIPYWRFKEVVEEKNKLQEQVNQMQEKIENIDDPEEIKEEYEGMTEELKQKNKEFLKTSDLKLEALKAGVRKEAIDDFVKVVDLDKLEVGDNDEVTGTKDIIETAQEEKSFFFGEEDKTVDKVGDDYKETGETTKDDSSIREVMGL